ncbi:MAG: DUF47 domain-containing protein [Armatimonadetes bacterium CG07_land_8_20_14_0_80_40_9]|nr:MAG: DUF47 domain-containing protein [Armatimonadetes bacterium CG07_land_8_20_14_0_80_40_9]
MGIFSKGKDFYKMLQDQADKVLEGMKTLEEYMKTSDPKKAERVRELEEEADELRSILIHELLETFVTPFDREDIFSLSRAIDDIIDYAKSTINEMLLFEITPTNYLEEITGVLVEMAKEINLAVSHLKKYPRIASEHAMKAKKVENKIERRYQRALVELFKSKDTIYILKVRELYRHLSNAADRGDEAGNIISDVVIKTT